MESTGARRSKSLFALALLLLSHGGVCLAETVLIPSGATWKYLDDGSDQGTAWRESAFEDSSWASGPAQLGYGDGDEATVVSYGPDPNWKYITTYFRHEFNVADPSQFPYAVIRLLRDDGAVVYVNGSEVVRSNMPIGVIDYETFASTAVAGSDEDRFFPFYMDVGQLIPGTNCIAVEIHQSGRTSSDISFDLEFASTMEPPPLVRKEPYLIYRGPNSEMQVLWQLSRTEDCTIEWGLDTLYTSGSAPVVEYGADHQHTYTITDLSPGMPYFYRIATGDEILMGSFRAVPSEDAMQVKFLAYGDTRTYPEQNNLVAEAMVATRVEDPEYLTFTGFVGDFVYNGGFESDWDSQFFDPSFTHIGELLAGAPLHSAMGNHELPGNLFMKYFPYPFVDMRYWSYDYGPLHVVVLDQYTSYYPGTPQHNWLVADLSTTTKPWKMIFLHAPGWSAGGHSNNTLVQYYIQPLCEEYDVSIVFGGHNHYYARAEVNGVQHITTGGGGAPLSQPNPNYPYVVAAAMAYHYCKVEIDAYHLTFNAVTPDGTLLDAFELDSDAAGIVEPITPVIMLGNASPNPFIEETTIELTPGGQVTSELIIADLQGRVVRRFVLPAGGSRRIDWDGTDTRGRNLPAGVYFYRLSSAAEEGGRRILLLR